LLRELADRGLVVSYYALWHEGVTFKKVFAPPNMDNLGSHKGRAVRAAIRAAKAKLFFLPAYSPDLNPIEQAFAKMKTLLRNADARTIDETWRTIGALLDCFTPKE
jgi:DDE superfamily endonuclease